MNRPQVVIVGDKTTSAIAVRRNELMLGSYRLSLWAQRVFLHIISEVKDEHTPDQDYELPIAGLSREVGIEDGNLYREMWAIVRERPAGCLALPWVVPSAPRR